MNTNTGDWTLSPNAAEFLPEEIDQLKRGTMKFCQDCQWPHDTNAPCDKCPAYNGDRQRRRHAGAALPPRPSQP